MVRVGQRLKEARLEKGLSLEQVAEGTKIRSSFLTAIEKGEYNRLPSASYAQGFVRNYAEFLGLPKREILALFRRDFDEEKIYKVLPEGFVRDESLPARRFKIHQAVFVIVGIVILLGGFLFYQYRSAFIDPPLEVTEPKEGAVTSQDITVTGETNPAMTLTVNGSPVTLEQNGTFIKRIVAFPGKATITVKAVNRFGRETVILRNIDVKTTP